MVKKLENYRAYFFVNMYMSGIHAGIQALHCLEEIHILSSSPYRLQHLHHWARQDKTAILLNGGTSENLWSIWNEIANGNHTFPAGRFQESEEALNSALTCVGVIVPESVWADPYESDPLYRLISKYPLAR